MVLTKNDALSYPPPPTSTDAKFPSVEYALNAYPEFLRATSRSPRPDEPICNLFALVSYVRILLSVRIALAPVVPSHPYHLAESAVASLLRK